jgi:hypothetical protein
MMGVSGATPILSWQRLSTRNSSLFPRSVLLKFFFLWHLSLLFCHNLSPSAFWSAFFSTRSEKTGVCYWSTLGSPEVTLTISRLIRVVPALRTSERSPSPFQSFLHFNRNFLSFFTLPMTNMATFLKKPLKLALVQLASGRMLLP